MAESEIVARARACIGARFRPQGRDPRWGLDCVGVAAVAFGRSAPTGYASRGGDRQAIAGMIDRAGLVRASHWSGAAGRLLLMEAGPAQHHLAVTTPSGFVHADARLRRIVETPGQPQWPILDIWQEEG